ncbi:MAG: aminopeptidase [Anaerolineales bacterium]
MNMNGSEFQVVLEKFARLIVEVGLNLQPGQRLFIWANQLELAPLVRQVAARAYQNGSPLVSVLWNDDGIKKARFDHAPKDSFGEYPAWKADARFQSVEAGDAALWIGGDSPDLLSDYDPSLVGAANQSYSRHMKPFLDRIAVSQVQWLVVCPPTPGWAQAVFPDMDPTKAEERLWQAVIKACRLDKPSPAENWEANLAALERRAAYLSECQYQSLHFQAPGTDLRVQLPKGHIWLGGREKTPEGVIFCANIPTEEIFTLPHREGVDGTVRATRPLSYQGSLIADFQLTFKDGKVVDFSAGKGEGVLSRLLESDESASHLGEVALVPHSSPISQQQLVFQNTLYDENASDHIALGNAYRVSLENGSAMSPEEFQAAGGNESQIHVDFMFGSAEMDVDGTLPDGKSEPLMRSGEWVLDI